MGTRSWCTWKWWLVWCPTFAIVPRRFSRWDLLQCNSPVDLGRSSFLLLSTVKATFEVAQSQMTWLLNVWNYNDCWWLYIIVYIHSLVVAIRSNFWFDSSGCWIRWLNLRRSTTEAPATTKRPKTKTPGVSGLRRKLVHLRALARDGGVVAGERRRHVHREHLGVKCWEV